MHRSKHAYLKVVLVLAAMAGLTGIMGANPINAATIQSLTLPSISFTGATCAGSLFRLAVDGTGSGQDGGGSDYVAFVTYEGNGTPIGHNWGDLHSGSNSFPLLAYSGGVPLGNDLHIVDLAFAPVTVKAYDISAQPSGTPADEIAAAEAAPLIGQASFDPRSDATLKTVCANLPYATLSIPALSPVGLAGLIGLLALGAVAVRRRRA